MLTTDQLIATNPGTGHAVSAHQQATNDPSDSAGNYTSTNEGASCLQVSGVEAGRGSIKVTHSKPPSGANDANASALSIWVGGVGSAAQGIHVDGDGSTGAVLDLRMGGVQLMKVMPDGTIHFKVGAQIKYDL